MSRVKTAYGFLAALDQSGGSTPKALRIYGIPDSVRLGLGDDNGRFASEESFGVGQNLTLLVIFMMSSCTGLRGWRNEHVRQGARDAHTYHH